jgi:uncharacterized phage-associated protein
LSSCFGRSGTAQSPRAFKLSTGISAIFHGRKGLLAPPLLLGADMTYSPTTIANYFLDRASQEARALTPMQLIKLVYIAHGWNLGYFDRPLIQEKVQAWKFGPVIESLYQQVKRFGSSAVAGRIGAHLPWMPAQAIDETTKSLLDHVWDSYRGFSGLQLSQMTHQPGTPWDNVWNTQGGSQFMGAEIDNEEIRAHYKRKIASR